MPYTLHVISHSHWDREWYMPLELHRRRLVKLLDDVLDVLDNDPDFGSFHLDGQAIPLEDYLEIRPHQRERLVAAAQAGRLTVGPWYILQDEFLTSAEAQVRNMLYGLRVAAQFGPPLKCGYLADAFGHIGQMPAILRGFGIDHAVYGRGLNKRQPNADPSLPIGERGYPSELIWRGSDGSEVLSIYMTNWYANAMDIPSEPQACLERFRAIRDNAAKYATTSHLLLMNGCDHTPCQLHISQLIATAQAGLEDTIVHTRLDDYAKAVLSEAGELDVATGELRSEFTNGWGTLTNVLSARLYLKQANTRCQHELEHYLEPLQAVSGLLGDPVDRDFRTYLWKLLLQNHPHDSICGCSVDPVHDEMETRFNKVTQLSTQLSDELMTGLAARVDTSGLPEGETAILVYNPLGSPVADDVEVMVDFPEDSTFGSLKVLDADGSEVPAIVSDLGKVWDYELPDDRFRVPYHRRRFRVEFQASVPAFGYTTFRAVPKPLALAEVVEPDFAEVLDNGVVRVVLGHDGTLTIIDLATGREWNGLNALYLGQDHGDEYKYLPPEGDVPVPLVMDEDWVWISRSPALQQAQCWLGWTSLDEADYDEFDAIGDLAFGFDPDGEPDDVIPDIGDVSLLGAMVTVSLPAGSRRVGVAVEIINQTTNCRLRAHFPTGRKTGFASADGHFEVVERQIEVWKGWENPSNCQPCNHFVDVSDGEAGLTIAPIGLPEYEVLRDGENTIALTLLRAVDRLGDWGDFPTPGAQCPGPNFAEYAIIPHEGPLAGSGADVAARAFNVTLRAVQTGIHDGDLPTSASWLDLSPAELVLSTVRWAEDRDAFIVRFYNPYAAPVEATLQVGLPVTNAWRCNLNEEREAELGAIGDGLKLTVGGREIVTLELG